MNSFRLLVLFISIGIHANSLLAQVQSPIPRIDPEALSILNSYVQAAGGLDALRSISDVAATGTISYQGLGKDASGPVSIRILGRDRIRLDASLPDGNVAWSHRGISGAFRDRDGKITTLPAHTLLNNSGLVFFFPRLLAGLGDPNAAITYLGVEQFAGMRAHHIRIVRELVPPSDASAPLIEPFAKDYYIDATTFLVVGIEDKAYAKDNLNDSLPHRLVLSDYRAVNGVAVPFAADETIAGQPIDSIRLAAVNFNVGLTDNDFDVK